MDTSLTPPPPGQGPEAAQRFLEFLDDLFGRAADLSYGAGVVSMCAHMLQTADLAEQDGAEPSQVAAGLLHDIGHFGTDYSFDFDDDSHTAMQRAGFDHKHENAGAQMLAPYFDAAVTEPIRLHVSAKRYLCAVDNAYLEGLTATTRHTLDLQGGPMSEDEVRAFEAETYGAAAAQVRRWDDQAMAAERSVAGFAHYRELLAGLMRTDAPA